MDRLVKATRPGGCFPKVAADPLHPRRLVAADDIASGESVFVLPQSLLLHGGLALADPEYGAAFHRLVEEAGPELDGRNLLVLLLLLERCRGPASLWAPYVSFLPEQYDDPSWWSGPELALLRGTRLAAAVEHYRGGLDRVAAWLERLEELRALGEEDSVARPPPGQGAEGAGPRQAAPLLRGWAGSREAALWARSTVWSRAFAVRGVVTGGGSGTRTGDAVAAEATAALEAVAGGSASGGVRPPAAPIPVICLVPLLDMADHSPEQSVAWHTGREGGGNFEFVTQRPITRGSEVFNNYGTAKSNEELLLGFGFCLEGNANDAFLVSPASGGGWSSSSSADSTCGSGAAGSGAAGSGDTQPHTNPVAAANVMGAGQDEGGCQDAAERVQRAALLRALCLPAEVPITAADPLPPALLDVLAVVTLPPWQLRGLAALQGGATLPAAVPAGAQPAAAGPESHGATGEGLVFPHLPLALQLRVLRALLAALQGRLDGMARPPGNSSAQGQPALACGELAAAAATAGGSSEAPWHTLRGRLAAVYVRLQRVILEAATAAARAKAAECSAAQPQPQPLQHQGQLGTAPAAGSDWAGPLAPDGQPGCGKLVLEGVEASGGGAQGSGWVAARPLSVGDAWLRVPLRACVTGRSRQHLVWALMCAAFRQMVAEQQQEGGQQVEQQGQQQRVEASAERRHAWLLLLSNHDASFGPSALLESDACGAVIEATSVGSQLQEAAEEAQSQFDSQLRHLRQDTAALEGAAAAVAEGCAWSCADAGAVLERLLLWPGAGRLFWWACNLADRGAIQMPGGGGNGVTPVLVVAPVLSLLPQAQRVLLVSCELSTSPKDTDPTVLARASCDWPVGCALGGSSAEHRGLPLEDILVQSGADAMSQAAAFQQQQEQQQQQQPEAEHDGHVARETIPTSCTVVSVAPPEDDPVRPAKLALLAATGLGVDHVLTAGDGPEQVRSLLAAMALALATPQDLRAAAATTRWPALLERWHEAQRPGTTASTTAALALGVGEGQVRPGDTAPSEARQEWDPLIDALLAARGAAARKQLKAALSEQRQELVRSKMAADTALAALDSRGPSCISAAGSGVAPHGPDVPLLKGCLAYAVGAMAAADRALALLKTAGAGRGPKGRRRSARDSQDSGGGGGQAKRTRQGDAAGAAHGAI